VPTSSINSLQKQADDKWRYGRARGPFSLFYSLCFFFFTHTLSRRSLVYVGGVCERDYYLADCFVRGANKALRLILFQPPAPWRTLWGRTEKRIMGGPVLLAQYKCRPLSRRQIKLSGRFVKARAYRKNALKSGEMQKDFLLRQFVRCQV